MTISEKKDILIRRGHKPNNEDDVYVKKENDVVVDVICFIGEKALGATLIAISITQLLQSMRSSSNQKVTPG